MYYLYILGDFMKESISEVKYVELLEEELWNDGELNKGQVMSRISYHLFMSGKWKLFKVVEDMD
jgi:hypothetical protein